MNELINSGVGVYVTAMLKALGVSLITHICSEVCRECKSIPLSDAVILAGKIELLILCFPLINDILRSAAELL